MPAPRATDRLGAVRSRDRLREPRRSGFTVIELTIIIGIIVLLASILMIKYQQAIAASKMMKAQMSLRTIALEIDSYYSRYGEFPDTLEKVGHGGRIDPWGNPYMYLNFQAGTGNALSFVLGNGLMDPGAILQGGAPSKMFDEDNPADEEDVEELKRKDQFLFPLNSDYDLFSVGPNGKAWASVAVDFSLDDVIRANDGGYYGTAADY